MPLRFVIQEHQARTHYFVFRLEKDGVLKSWILPTDFPLAAGEKRLAIQVESHASAYGRFEGAVPAGEYGIGTVRIWDKGTYDVRGWTSDHIRFKLKDRQVEGDYSLDRFPSAATRGWLFTKQGDLTK